MSTRWYPLYQKGNPQLRVFLPNFWMKLINVPEKDKDPPNIVRFICSNEMTRIDVKNYLEKIYNIPVITVRTMICMGRFRREQLQGSVVKDDDFKVAVVTLPKDQKFEFPNIFPNVEEKMKEDMKIIDQTKKEHQKYVDKAKTNPGIPAWFS